MATRVADALVDTLGAHGVQSVYGVPGDSLKTPRALFFASDPIIAKLTGAPGNGAAIFGTALGGRA